jgi:ribonuclease VapC
MVVDSSAILAILQREPDAAIYVDAIAAASERYISAVAVLETNIVVIRRRGPEGASDVEDFIADSAMKIVPFDAAQAALASTAFATFGRSRHPASLNFGDCAAYALAKSLNQPLLFKGNDFALTDVIRALP